MYKTYKDVHSRARGTCIYAGGGSSPVKEISMKSMQKQHITVTAGLFVFCDTTYKATHGYIKIYHHIQGNTNGILKDMQRYTMIFKDAHSYKSIYMIYNIHRYTRIYMYTDLQ